MPAERPATYARRRPPELDVALVVAAVDRAGDDWPYQRPRCEDYDGPDGSATVECVREHLGGRRRSRRVGDGWGRGRTWQDAPYDREVRRALKAAAEAGWVVKLPPPRGQGAQLWLVTVAGDAMLGELAAIAMAPELPESPAHRRWRERRECALRELPDIRERMREEARAFATLADAQNMAELEEMRDCGARSFYTFDLQDALKALDAEEPA